MVERSKPAGRLDWITLPREKLLDLRLCDLGLGLSGTALGARVEQLWGELARRGLRFQPHVWLSTDWFTPDHVPGFAVPFFLGHTRLARLERKEMLEVEGGTHDWCLKLLRHEAAHALDNAFHLHRRRDWREVFGRFSDPYRDTYTPKPTSKRFVLNLDYWYSQSHPAEDWAETFAVWLKPGSRWRRDYAGWPALAKLEYVDTLMAELAGQAPTVRDRSRMDPLSSVRTTLREYYAEKKERYDDERPKVLDRHLQRAFSDDPQHARRESAASFLRRTRRELVQRVSAQTGQHRYLIDHVLRDLITRCRTKRLRLKSAEREARIDAAVLLTILTMDFLHRPHPQYRR